MLHLDDHIGKANQTEGYYLSPEALAQMTLQIALAAKDGIILASDKCGMFTSRYARETAAQTYGVKKIVDRPGDKVAYAFSGDYVSEEAGRNLAKALSVRNGFDFSITRDELERIGNETYDAEKPRLASATVGRVLMVVIYRDDVQLWRLDIEDSRSRATRVSDFVAGDYPNTARFFKERYWRIDTPRTLEELKLLVAHIILMGGEKIKRQGIEGLDVAVITSDKGFRFLDDHEISRLRERSQSLDKQIESLLFDPAR